MATTEELLKLSTRGALVRMINDENGTLFDGGEAGPLVFSEPLSVGGLRTEVEISIRRRLSGMDELPYPGQLAFRYNRLDVEVNLGGKLNGFRPEMPTSTQVLLDELTRRTGIKFELEDFILEDIIRANAAPYFLRARPESMRWVGGMYVALIDLTDLSTYIPGGLPVGVQTLPIQSPPAATRNMQPYLNATAHRNALNSIVVNDQVMAVNHPLVAFLENTVPQLGTFLRDNVTPPWRVLTGAATYNLRQARLIAKAEPIANLNPLVPAANLAARVRLSSLDTAYGDKDLLIPYAIPNLNNSQFNNTPRLKATAVINASNGTPWNKWLNSLVAPSVITSLPNGMDLRFSGPDRWVADANNPSPTNLYNAVVQYNGSRRAYDARGFYPECNRVLVVTIGDRNTAYQGNLSFHYRAPIVINEQMPDAILGTNYDFALSPTEGTAPYVFTRVSGALAPTHALTADHRIAGATTQTGNFQIVYDVRDATNTTVRYTLNYRVIVAPLTLTGSPPPATLNVPYEYTFGISGGIPPYSYRLISEGGNHGLSLPDPLVPRIAGTMGGAPGNRSFILEATDNQGTVTTYNFTIPVS